MKNRTLIRERDSVEKDKASTLELWQAHLRALKYKNTEPSNLSREFSTSDNNKQPLLINTSNPS